MSVTSPDEIKAGRYEVAAVQLDVPTSKPGQPLTYVRHRTGALVDLDAAEARRLVLAGAVVEPGAREKAAAEAAKAVYEAALAALSPEARAAITGQPVRRRRAQPSTPPTGGAPTPPPTETDTGADEPDDDAEGADEPDEAPDGGQDSDGPQRPPRVAAKAVWADYVVETGVLPREEADALTKDELVARVREHEAQQTEG
ncbi:hypothetical protein WDZ16_12970 [Pseudokineococcus marinus]|uniref:Uncharacterized protein n=1 Tax=Pseudokineococcus marinus TaxID=351215 RepID=A0A849BQ20_9ACTN|nr:hypothetical protein [Pseudokineococcus marinus]NNH21646.1 hypothetical protein [Pseudokineococcus marinus]